jgi:RNase P subunit RPR2
MICKKCDCGLTPAKKEFSYLGRNFSAEVPVCPNCGAVYVSEDFVNERMKKIESAIEDK